ncbi:placenta-specific gene 8 protein-like [Erythrolamprus reginae]|uniref:placenta-specific gene 8 protein-like n=1 Tax=Erythrolamprus reginae TaxID=121349 RepID=UPI00396C404C
MNPHVVMSQPQMVVTQHQSPEWQTGLLDCFSDCGVCICGLFCPLCLGCQVAADMDECCLCGASMAMRSVYRTKYGIQGSLVGDFCATMFCTLCSVCQLKRDINQRKDKGIF